MPAALADLLCAVVNLTRTGKPVRRPEVLESWGLRAQAEEFRRAESEARAKKTEENIRNFFNKIG